MVGKKLKDMLKRNWSESERQMDIKGRRETGKRVRTGRDRAIESGEVRAGLWEKNHRQNFKLCLWHCSHTLTSTVPAWEYLKTCQTLFRVVVIHFGAGR